MQGHTYKFTMVISDDMTLAENAAILTFMNASKSLVKEPLEAEATGKGCIACWTCTAGVCTNGERNKMELALPIDDFGNCRCAPGSFQKVV